MRDYDSIDMEWLPHVMFFQKAGVSFPHVSTDSRGFRTTIGDAENNRVSTDEFLSGGSKKGRGIVLGSSAAFGVGATGDGFTVASRLNQKSNTLWANYGGRAYTSTQEILLLLFLCPEKLDQVIVFSGINNLLVSIMAPKTSSSFGSIYFQSKFDKSMRLNIERHITIREALRQLFDEVRARWSGAREVKPFRPAKENLQNMLERFKGDMTILNGFCRAKGVRPLFLFQPMAQWINKLLSREEKQLFSILDNLPSSPWKELRPHLDSYRERYLEEIEGVCRALEIPFLDLNKRSEFKSEEWLFVDRVHLTDKGYERVSDIAREYLAGDAAK